MVAGVAAAVTLTACGDECRARGELPDVPRPARVVNLPFDLLRHDVLMTLRPLPEESIVDIVDEVWLPLLAHPRRASSASRIRSRP